MAFEDRVKKLVAEYLEISGNEILEIELINAVGYSVDVLNKAVALIALNDLERLEDEELNSSDNPDTLSIYQVTMSNKNHMALLFEPFELYDNARILKTIEIRAGLPATQE